MTKKKSMYSVAQVLSPKFQRSWNESVAIVQDVAANLSPGLTVPAPEDLLFEEDGRVSFGFGSESNEAPVVSLAKLLRDLLEGTNAPPGLRDLARDNATESPSHTSVESFSRALAFYERPNRTSDLRAVRERLGGRQAAPDPEVEFERLREKLAGKPAAAAAPATPEKPEKKEEKKPEPKPRRQLSRQHQAIIAASIGLLLLTALAAFSRTRYTAEGESIVDRTEDKLARALSAGLNRLGGSKNGATMTAEAAAPETPTRAASSGSGPSSGSGRRAAEAPESAAVPTSGKRSSRDIVLPKPSGRRAPASPAGTPAAAARADSPASIGAPLVPPLPSATAPASEPAPSTPPVDDAAIDDPIPGESVVYTTSDRGVRPPRLIRPQLPKEPEPGQDTGYFDLVVNELGDVVQVKLLSPRRLFQERMLVAAAKAWKFSPAMLAGQPVKYRLRIPIIIAGMP